MRPEIFIAGRLSLGNGSKTPLGVRIGVFGVALAFVVMLVSVSVVTGFKKEISRKVEGFEADVVLAPTETSGDVASIDFSAPLRNDIEAAFGSEAVVDSVIDLQALLKTDDDFEGVIIRGVAGDSPLRQFISQAIVDGGWSSDPEGDYIVISRSTALKLKLEAGDKVYAHFLVDENLKTRRLKVAAVYDTHFEDYDRNLAFSSINLGRSVNGWPSGRFSMLTVGGLDRSTLPAVVSDFETKLIGRLIGTESLNYSDVPQVSTVFQRGALYFNWLELLDTNVVVILVLMAVVSAFTLISSLFILILQRVSTIGLLKSLGATDGQIQRIFLFLGQKIVLRGLVWGNLTGCSVVLLQYFTHILPLDPTAYYLTYVPVDLNFAAWIILNLSAMAIALLVLLLPARSISRMSLTAALNFRRLGD